ncbi:MAG: hypothetical protein WBP81_06015 [Solirubrobacteraceae bacterium]
MPSTLIDARQITRRYVRRTVLDAADVHLDTRSRIGPVSRRVLQANDRPASPGPMRAARVPSRSDGAITHATRSSKHVEQRRPRFETTREQRDELAREFFEAAEQGDLAGLETLLASDVALTGDGGDKVPALARSLRAHSRVARTVINWFRLGRRPPGVSLRLVADASSLLGLAT